MSAPGAVLDERGRRRARVNAAAAHIAARTELPRGLTAPPTGELRPSHRRRLHAGTEARVRPRRRAVVLKGASVGFLIVQVAALGALLMLPTFTPHDITIDGARLLPDEAIIRAAAIPSASIFTLDGDAVRGRLQNVPLVRSVRVTTSLPASVHISVTEWKPVLRVVLPTTTLLVAENGGAVEASSIRTGSDPAVPVIIDRRTGSVSAGLAPGQTLDPRFAQLLASTAAHFPSVFGTNVAAYVWEPDGILSVWSDHGWRAILGHVDTADQVAAVPSQLAALAALRGQLSFTSPQFGYVNVENPESLAVGGLVGLPPEVVAVMAPGTPAAPAPAPTAPTAAPAAPVVATPVAPTPTSTPAPTPAPATASPAGGPYVIYVPQSNGH